ncbi:uncharacterized protein LOC133806915 [Humulus lupulus]|uniref:uncharacterized protein LOC133806915 n=1 Tax=Humulus lupulus TaxID=3486 RepID=UPI002B41104E|nr:uncharacterized protein LOC133806915 [Humulus lupulus]
MLCWAIWRAHNELVWQKKGPWIDEVVSSSSMYIDQWRNAQCNNIITPSFTSLFINGVEILVKPQTHTIKVNVDAAIFRESGKYGYSNVAGDHEGKLVEARTYCREGRAALSVAEAISV